MKSYRKKITANFFWHGKELSIYLCQSFIYNFFKIKNITNGTEIKYNKLDNKNIPQIINLFSIKIQINN